MATRPARLVVRLSRAGLDGLDRVDARYVMGANNFLLFAIACCTVYLAMMIGLNRGQLWPAVWAQAGLVAALVAAIGLNAMGWSSVGTVLAPLVPFGVFLAHAQFFGKDAGFLFPFLVGPALAFVTFPPRRWVWRVVVSVAPPATAAWAFLSPQFAEPTLDVSEATVSVMLMANTALTTVFIGAISWLNAYYFTRERRRAERLLREAEHLARTDTLTQLANRRGMTDTLTAQSTRADYAVAVVDVDRFKSINDSFGHGRGDHILAEVARTLADAVGDDGVVSRWGGEEFLVFFPAVRLSKAAGIMERARRVIERGVPEAGHQESVTISAGIAGAAAGTRWEVAVSVADALVYDAKEEGRNCVRSAQVRTAPSGPVPDNL